MNSGLFLFSYKKIGPFFALHKVIQEKGNTVFAKLTKLLLFSFFVLSITACNNDLRTINNTVPVKVTTDPEANESLNHVDPKEVAVPKTPVDEGDESTVKCLSERSCAMQEAVNEVRQTTGHSLLKFDPVCGFIAQEHAEDMFFNSYLSHTNREGQKSRERYEENGKVTLIYENITHGTDDISMALNEWLNSASHREALMSDEVTHHGVGVWGEGSNTHWVHCIIRP